MQRITITYSNSRTTTFINSIKYKHIGKFILFFFRSINRWYFNVQTSISNTSPSSDDATLNDSSSKQISPSAQRKRSHSKSDSDTSENTNDLSKKSK